VPGVLAMIFTRSLTRVLAPASAALVLGCAPPTATGPLPQQAYVWQRSWSPAVIEAVQEDGELERLVALGAEVVFSADGPRVTRTAVDFEALRRRGVPLGLALRIGPVSDPAAHLPLLTSLAVELVAEARAHGPSPAELQLDFDAPESRLAGYAPVLAAVREAVAPVPLTLTVLPSWLPHEDAFRRLLDVADGFVLQVHSLELPEDPGDHITLCDPDRARRDVARAARFGRSFRVALPTHSYLVALDADGHVLDVAAEDLPEDPGTGRVPDPAVRWVEARSDPVAMVELVQGWRRDRPAELAGVVWFRLPTREDRRAWRPETFRAVLAGRVPQGRVEVEQRHPRPGLLEVDLVNRGDGPAPLPATVRLDWRGVPLAGDAVAGYRWKDPARTTSGEHASGGELTREAADPTAAAWLEPGERRTVAWVRFQTARAR